VKVYQSYLFAWFSLHVCGRKQWHAITLRQYGVKWIARERDGTGANYFTVSLSSRYCRLQMSVQTNCIVIYLAVSRRQSPQSSIIVTGVSMYAFQIGVRGGRYLGDKPQQMAVEQNSGNIVGKFWHRQPVLLP